MKKVIVLLAFGLGFSSNFVKAQSLNFSIKGGFVYPSGSLDSDIGFMVTGSLENKFNKYFSLGVNGKLGGVTYSDEETFWSNNTLIQENELDISNNAYSLNIFSKLSVHTGDEIIISIIPEFGFFLMESKPVIYFHDKSTNNVTHINYDNKYNRDLSYGLHLEAQYYLNEKVNILASIGWNNYNIGSSLNKINLEGDWNFDLNEKTDFLYFEVGIVYLLFGKNYQ